VRTYVGDQVIEVKPELLNIVRLFWWVGLGVVQQPYLAWTEAFVDSWRWP
jgi:hypothetical protein